MKLRAKVIDVADPNQYGRIRVQLIGYDEAGNETPWCWPCSPFAGPGYGFYCLPEIDDEVYVERLETSEWIWVGFHWSGRNPKPTDGTAKVRVFQTKAGHQLKFDEEGSVKLTHSSESHIDMKSNGDIELLHENGSQVILRANGDVEIQATKNVLINDNGQVRAVNTRAICSYTGLPHPQGSRTVFTEKP